MGLPFERVVEAAGRFTASPASVENDLQTNGLLLDAGWVAFLKQHGFVVGLSIDGPADLHDPIAPPGAAGRPRQGHAGRRAFAQASVPFAALCVVNRGRAAFRSRSTASRPTKWAAGASVHACVEPRTFADRAPALLPAAQ